MAPGIGSVEILFGKAGDFRVLWEKSPQVAASTYDLLGAKARM